MCACLQGDHISAQFNVSTPPPPAKVIIRVINHHHHNHYHYHKASERKWPNRTKEEEEEEEEQKNKQNDVKAGVQQTVCVQYIKVLLLLPRLNWTGKGKSPTPAGTRRLFIHFLFLSLSHLYQPTTCVPSSITSLCYILHPPTHCFSGASVFQRVGSRRMEQHQ